MNVRLRFLPRVAVPTLAIGFLAVGIAAVAQQRSRSDEPQEAVLEKIPAKARSKDSRILREPDAPLAGRKLFVQHCAECHGAIGEGSRRGPSLQSAVVQHATPGELFWILTNGVVRHGMPSWSKLPEPERWQIVAFLQRHDKREAGTVAVRPVR